MVPKEKKQGTNKGKQYLQRSIKRQKENKFKNQKLRQSTILFNDQVIGSTPRCVKKYSKFIDVKSTTKYEDRIKSGRKIMPGYIVEPLDFTNGFETILNNFASLGWKSLLYIKNSISLIWLSVLCKPEEIKCSWQ